MRFRATVVALLTPLVPGGAGIPAEAKPARFLYDFGARDVVIWSEPREGSGRNGLGNPGQGFESNRSEQYELFDCGHFDSTLWHHGRNVDTDIAGWVPACNLTDTD